MIKIQPSIYEVKNLYSGWVGLYRNEDLLKMIHVGYFNNQYEADRETFDFAVKVKCAYDVTEVDCFVEDVVKENYN